MTLKEKLKVFALTTIGVILGYCGYKQIKGDGGISRDSKEWTVKPEQLAFGRCDTILFSDAAKYYLDHSNDKFRNIALLEASYGRLLKDYEMDKMSARLTKALQQQNIAVEKEDSLLRSVDYADGKFSNPVYEVNPKEEMKTTSVESVGGVKIKRNGGKSVMTTLDPKTIAISSEKDASYQEHFSKLRKVVEDKKIEKGLHKGDTIEYDEAKQIVGNRLRFIGKQAIVEKDGVSPTYEEEKVKEHNVFTLKFNYARKQVDDPVK